MRSQLLIQNSALKMEKQHVKSTNDTFPVNFFQLQSQRNIYTVLTIEIPYCTSIYIEKHNRLEQWFSNLSVYQNYVGGLLQHRFLDSTPSLLQCGIGPMDLHFEQVPRCDRCSWFKKHTQRITVLEHGHNEPKDLSSNLISLSCFNTGKILMRPH